MPGKRARESAVAWKGIAAGLAGGLVGIWTMEVYQSFWSKLAEAQRLRPPEDTPPGQRDAGSRDEVGEHNLEATPPGISEDDPATVKAAAAVARVLFHYELMPGEKQVAGTAAHYAIGMVTGAVYGFFSEYAPLVTTVAGAAWGASVWMVAENLAMPLLRLAKWPTSYPPGVHACALSSHLVYGVTGEVVRRIVRQSAGNEQ